MELIKKTLKEVLIIIGGFLLYSICGHIVGIIGAVCILCYFIFFN